ncbi:MAG TPA: hypothetical protein VFP65_08955 [Anaeromyxobacteraceae bacterium]|nr:hypothetical protein [Anaeromyxobacteraceae bacterium]
MSLLMQSPARALAAPRSARTPWTTWLFRTAVAVLLAAVVVGVLVELSAKRRALRTLPAEQRAAVLARTLEELRETCGPGAPDVLRDHCRELASFAAQFDDCRGECEALVRGHLTSSPTR